MTKKTDNFDQEIDALRALVGGSPLLRSTTTKSEIKSKSKPISSTDDLSIDEFEIALKKSKSSINGSTSKKQAKNEPSQNTVKVSKEANVRTRRSKNSKSRSTKTRTHSAEQTPVSKSNFEEGVSHIEQAAKLAKPLILKKPKPITISPEANNEIKTAKLIKPRSQKIIPQAQNKIEVTEFLTKNNPKRVQRFIKEFTKKNGVPAAGSKGFKRLTNAATQIKGR